MTKHIHLVRTACDTLENVLPDQAYQRNKGLKEWSFGLFEGDSVQLLDAVWDKHDILELDYAFGGETKMKLNIVSLRH